MFRGVVALTVLIGTTVPSIARAQAPTDWRAAVQQLLQQRARAVQSGDRRAFDATMSFAPAAFRANKDTWFARMRALPIGSYSLSFDPNGYQDLSDALAQRPAGDEVHVGTVLEQIGFKTYDPTPSSEDLYLTVVRRGSTWSIVSDTDLESIGLPSFRNVWDFAPVGELARDGVIVLYQGDRATAQRILTATIAAIAYDNKRWPLKWPGRIVEIIPRSTKELSRILQTTFDLGPFVAFTASSESRPSGQYRLTGTRVYVQPATFFNSPVAYQQDTLSHELLHVATRGYASTFTPSWMDEGDAQVYGQRQQPALLDVRARIVNHTFTGLLPEDFEFSLGSDADIHNSYEEASSFVLYLNARFGKDAGANLYRALGNESPVSFGTARYHLDHACRTAFGVGFADLERAWAQKIHKEFG
jgi:hypothetical protein